MAAKSFRKNEFGVDIVIGTGFDMSANSGLTIKFVKPDCVTVLSVPAALGITQIVSPIGTFAANTWASYTFMSGDLDQSGTWKAELQFDDPSPRRLFSNIVEFEVVDSLCS